VKESLPAKALKLVFQPHRELTIISERLYVSEGMSALWLIKLSGEAE